jgi:predicted aspartyl protease
MALAWAIDTGSMYIARNHAIQVPFQLQTQKKRANKKALLDSGATECFIHPRMVQQLRLKTKNLQKPRKVQNIDGTPNKAGEIQQACKMTIRYQGKRSKHNFFLANIGIDNVILGYPFFEDLLPDINWKQGKITGNVSLETAESMASKEEA